MTELRNSSLDMLNLRNIYNLVYNFIFLHHKFFKYTESFTFCSRAGILRRGCRRTLHWMVKEKRIGGGKMAKKKLGGKYWSPAANRDRFQSHLRP